MAGLNLNSEQFDTMIHCSGYTNSSTSPNERVKLYFLMFIICNIPLYMFSALVSANVVWLHFNEGG